MGMRGGVTWTKLGYFEWEVTDLGIGCLNNWDRGGVVEGRYCVARKREWMSPLKPLWGTGSWVEWMTESRLLCHCLLWA
jgi:uncharacterized membrane protein